MSWTIEQELLDITSRTSIDDAIASLEIVPSQDRVREICIDVDWHRSGAETFSFAFSLRLYSGTTVPLLLKACVAFSPNTTAGALLEEWLQRRSVLRARQVSTPRLFAVHKACVLEERIPYTFWSALRTQVGSGKADLLRSLSGYAGVLSQEGFAGVDPYGDLMSRGHDLVVVDFGQDLGPPHIREERSGHYFTEALDSLAQHGFSCTAAERMEMFAVFELAENGKDGINGAKKSG